MTDETPHEIEAEEQVLGAILYSAGRAFDELEGLSPRDFYRPLHEQLFALMAAMRERGEPIERASVEPAAAGIRGIEPATVVRLEAGCVAWTNVGFYARKVRGAAVKRNVIAAGARIMQLGRDASRDASSVVTEAQNAILGLDAPAASGGRYIGAILEDVMEAAESGRAAVPTLAWPYGEKMPPLPCGRMVIVAGRPGMGKSTCGLDAARHAAIHLGLPVAFFSLEMSQAEIGARTAAAEANIPLPHVQKGEMTSGDWEAWARRMGLVMDAPLWVDDFPRADPSYIRSAVRRLVRERGSIGLVVVDYLQLMEDDGAAPSKSRQQIVSDFSRSLTILAKELETAPVLALAQLNRGSEMRADRKPQVSDLRESGSLEQDAAQVILIHREDVYERESPRSGEVDLIIGKNRGGPTTTVSLAAQLLFSRFAPMGDDIASTGQCVA